MNRYNFNVALAMLTIGSLFGGRAVHAEEIFEGFDQDEGIRHELHALETEVAALRTTVSVLKEENSTLQTQLVAVRSNRALLLGPFVSVDSNPEAGVAGPHIIFSGANVHIVSGLGATDDNGNPSGLGNLIIGYDEPPGLPGTGTPLNPGDRGGSHNLVIGRFNRFTQTAFGGLVAGEANIISNDAASVTGGNSNAATGVYAAVTGGQSNTASGFFAVVTGGQANIANGLFTSVTGGQTNVATGIFSAVTGGTFNTANGGSSSISGGESNTTIDGADSVCGGNGNTASGFQSVVIGGQNITTNYKPQSIAPQPPFP